MREDRCVDLLRWNNNNFKELMYKAKIGQKMSLEFNFKIITSLKQAGAERGQTKCKI